MQQVGKFNAISAELKKQIPKLKNGEVVTFQMLTGQKNNDPDEKERQRNPILYPKANIPMRDRIKDLHTGEWVDIIVADGWDGDKPTRERFFMPGKDDGETTYRFGGKFQLVGGNQRDEEMYEFLMLTNYNKDSVLGENRDASKQPLFELVSAKVANEKASNSFEILKQAIEIVSTLKIQDARKVLAALNKNTFTEDDAAMAEVKNFARSKPDEFLKVWNNPNKDIKADVRKALDEGVLDFDILTGKVKLNTEEITTIADQDRDNVVEALTIFINTAKNGKNVYNNIKKQLKDLEPA